MSGGVNKSILVGNVGTEPEINTFENGSIKARFRFATPDSYTNKSGEKIDTSEWHNVEVWGGRAAVVQKFVKKGMKLYIEGKTKTRSLEKEDGTVSYYTFVECLNFQMLSSKEEIN